MSFGVVAKAINELDSSEQVKECLMELFTFELRGTGNKNAPFKKDYRNAITNHAANFKDAEASHED